MKRQISKAILCLVLLTALLLSACGNGPEPGPAPTPAGTAAPAEDPVPTESSAPGEDPAPTESPDLPAEAEEPPILLPEDCVRVSTVDELLAAIAPDTAVVLEPGVYDLSSASDYGNTDSGGVYRWDDAYDGYALVLERADGLQLLAPEGAEILSVPRYAAVLSLHDCQDVTLAGLTLGHSEAPGICSGGVLYLGSCENVELRSCRLFGCGTEGIGASFTNNLHVSFTEIYDCSLWGAEFYACRRVLMEDCRIHDCGKTDGGWAYQLLQVQESRDVAVVNTSFTDNRAGSLLSCENSRDVSMLGCRVEDNLFFGTLFCLRGQSVLVEDCGFSRRGEERYYDLASGDLMAVDRNGSELLTFDLDRMERKRAEYLPPEAETAPEPAAPREEEYAQDGTRLVRVSTVDDFLAAIGPDTTIQLEEGVYDLSAASGYGGQGGDWYSWEERYDGPSLRISGVSNLRILGAGRAITQLLAEPRYASVLSFDNCRDVLVFGLTAGHTPKEAYCTGNVLDFVSCRNAEVKDCGLFGCGVIGVFAEDCRHVQVSGTEIYNCSWMAASFEDCTDVFLDDCSIYGCTDGRNYLEVSNSWVKVNGLSLKDGLYLFDYRELRGAAPAA